MAIHASGIQIHCIEFRQMNRQNEEVGVGSGAHFRINKRLMSEERDTMFIWRLPSNSLSYPAFRAGLLSPITLRYLGLDSVRPGKRNGPMQSMSISNTVSLTSRVFHRLFHWAFKG